MPNIGVQMMMLKSQVEESGPHETLSRLSKMGFNSVEVSQIPMTARNVAEMRQARDELGMEYAALSAAVTTVEGSPNDSLTTDFEKIVHDAKTLGSNKLRIGMMPFPAMRSHSALMEFCHEANTFARQLADEGIGLYYHNHHIEFAKVEGELMLDLIRAEAPEMRLEIDVHWVQRGGRDPVRTLQKYAGLVDLVHLKDYRISELGEAAFVALQRGDFTSFMQEFTGVVQFGEVGEGNLEWSEIIDTAIEAGAEHLLIEQDDQYGRDPFDALQTSHDNLVELGYGHLM